MMKKNESILEFDWEVPTINKSNSRPTLSAEEIVISRSIPAEHKVKSPNVYLKINSRGAEKYLKGSNYIAFSFQKDGLLITFEPPEGIPSYKVAKSAKDKVIYNQILITKIFDHFKLDKKKKIYKLIIEEFPTKNDFKLFKVIPTDYDTGETL